MDNDVPAPSSQIQGIPPQFDELVLRSTARDAAHRYADAADMGAELARISAELALPAFRVPAPSNSAQHASAELHHSRVTDERTKEHRPAGPASRGAASDAAAALGAAPVRHPTRAMTRAGDDWDEPATDGFTDEYPELVAENFAGIELAEFVWARQRARRMMVVWTIIVLVLTGAVAAGAWAVGSNLSGLL